MESDGRRLKDGTKEETRIFQPPSLLMHFLGEGNEAQLSGFQFPWVTLAPDHLWVPTPSCWTSWLLYNLGNQIPALNSLFLIPRMIIVYLVETCMIYSFNIFA